MGVVGLMGLMGGIDGKGAPRGESRSGDFYRTGETRLQGRGKGVTWRGKRRERERKGKGKEEREKKGNEKNSLVRRINMNESITNPKKRVTFANI